MLAALLFRLALALDEPCTEDVYRPCAWIEPAVPIGYETANARVILSYDIGFRGFAYGFDADGGDEALEAAVIEAARQWRFAPFRYERNGESVVVELRDGVWIDPWAEAAH